MKYKVLLCPDGEQVLNTAPGTSTRHCCDALHRFIGGYIGAVKHLSKLAIYLFVSC